MTRITAEALYGLLPAVHRLRDADQGEPLRALVAVLAREGAVIEENIEQLLDDLFIETSADWVAPYIGGVIGYRGLHRVEGLAGPRAEVANTIGYRRRKGTAAVLEQLARDVTGSPARVVEYFRLAATYQHMNHPRPDHHWASQLHDPLALQALGGAFDRHTHTVDVRSIDRAPGRSSIGGKHNLPNVGVFLWRLLPIPVSNAPTTRVDGRRHLFDALGAPRQLVNRPEAEEEITHLSEPVNAPVPIRRRALAAEPARWYGRSAAGSLRAFEITVDGAPIATTRIQACDLSDDGGGWHHSPHAAIDPAVLAEREGADTPEVPAPNALVRVDPELGRIAFPEEEEGEVRVSFHTAFPAWIGGGEYDRAAGLAPPTPGRPLIALPNAAHPTVQDALDALPAAGGIIEIRTNDVFDAPAAITAAAGAEVEVRAADGVRPILRATAPIELSGGPDARIRLGGLVIEGEAVRVVSDADGRDLKEVTVADSTLVPGLGFTDTGEPRQPGAVSMTVDATGVELFLSRVIAGPLRLHVTTNADIRDSIVDAAGASSIESIEGLAIAGPDDEGDPSGALTIVASSVIGRIVARAMPLVSNTILFARDPGDGTAPVRSLRGQQGCLRFSFVPEGSVTPRRYRCQPQLAIDQAVDAREAQTGASITSTQRALIAGRIARWLTPSFSSLSASHPAYCQLRRTAPHEIRAGASNESEMGVYNHLFQPQREANLRIRLEEYLRFGLEAGVFFET